MNQKKQVPRRRLGIAQLERIRLEELHKKDPIFQTIQCPKVVPTSSRIDFSSKVLCDEYSQGVNQKVDNHGIVFGHKLNLPGVLQQRSQQYQKKKVPRGRLGIIAQLERIRLEELHKKDPIFQTIQCPKVIPTSSRIDFSLKDCVFTPYQSAPCLENCSKVLCDEYSLGVNQKVDHHGVVFGHKLNLPGVLQQRSQQYHKTSSSTSVVNISSGISSSSAQNLQMEPRSNQSYYGCKCLPLWLEEVKMAGAKRPYPFSQECPHAPSFRCKLPQCYVGPVSRSREAASSSDECSANVEERNVLKREVVSQSRVLSESKSLITTKALNGDFLRLAPLATAFPHLKAENKCPLTDSAPQCLQPLDYVRSRVAAAIRSRTDPRILPICKGAD